MILVFEIKIEAPSMVVLLESQFDVFHVTNGPLTTPPYVNRPTDQLVRGALHRADRSARRHLLRVGADAHPDQHVQLGALPLLRRHIHLPGDQGT